MKNYKDINVQYYQHFQNDSRHVRKNGVRVISSTKPGCEHTKSICV